VKIAQNIVVAHPAADGQEFQTWKAIRAAEAGNLTQKTVAGKSEKASDLSGSYNASARPSLVVPVIKETSYTTDEVRVWGWGSGFGGAGSPREATH
jgi:hypothetical protein